MPKKKRIKKNTEDEVNEIIFTQLVEKEKEEKNKKIIMWSGVTFCMFLACLVWILNIDSILASSSKNLNDKKDGKDLKNIVKDFNVNFEKVKKEFEKINQIVEEQKEKSDGKDIFKEVSTSSDQIINNENNFLTNEENLIASGTIDDLKNFLEKNK